MPKLCFISGKPLMPVSHVSIDPCLSVSPGPHHPLDHPLRSEQYWEQMSVICGGESLGVIEESPPPAAWEAPPSAAPAQGVVALRPHSVRKSRQVREDSLLAKQLQEEEVHSLLHLPAHREPAPTQHPAASPRLLMACAHDPR